MKKTMTAMLATTAILASAASAALAQDAAPGEGLVMYMQNYVAGLQ